MPIQSATGYCPCGAEIYIEYIRDGAGWVCRFSAEGKGEITRCPQCGRELVEDELESL